MLTWIDSPNLRRARAASPSARSRPHLDHDRMRTVTARARDADARDGARDAPAPIAPRRYLLCTRSDVVLRDD
jgi:hypothetical protein